MPPRRKNTAMSAAKEGSYSGEQLKLHFSECSDDEQEDTQVKHEYKEDDKDEHYEDEIIQPRTTQRRGASTRKKIRTSFGKTTKTKAGAKPAIKERAKKTAGEEGVKIAKAGVTTLDIVLAALSSSQDKKGMSLEAIKKYYILYHPEKELRWVKTLVKKAMLRGLKERRILRAKSSSEAVGVRGRFKINEELTNATAKKVLPSVASQSGQSKKKVAKAVGMKKKLEAENAVEIGKNEAHLKKSMKSMKMEAKNAVEKGVNAAHLKKSMKIMKVKRGVESPGKENKLPRKQGKPSKNKLNQSVETVSKKSKSAPAKFLVAKNKNQGMLDTKPLKKSNSAPVKASESMK